MTACVLCMHVVCARVMCVCVFMCVYVHMCACVYVCMCVHVHVCIVCVLTTRLVCVHLHAW